MVGGCLFGALVPFPLVVDLGKNRQNGVSSHPLPLGGSFRPIDQFALSLQSMRIHPDHKHGTLLTIRIIGRDLTWDCDMLSCHADTWDAELIYSCIACLTCESCLQTRTSVVECPDLHFISFQASSSYPFTPHYINILLQPWHPFPPRPRLCR